MIVCYYHHHHILDGLNTNLMSRSLQNVLTNFFIPRYAVMAKKTDVQKFKIQTTVFTPF